MDKRKIPENLEGYLIRFCYRTTAFQCPLLMKTLMFPHLLFFYTIKTVTEDVRSNEYLVMGKYFCINIQYF